MEGKIVAKSEQMVVSERQKVEMADAHCHLDLMKDHSLVLSAIERGVLTIITDGVNALTSRTAVKIATLSKNVFAAIGIDPENAPYAEARHLIGNVKELQALALSNEGRVVAIGEIGLDYMKANTPELVAKQKMVFEAMLDLANELELPVSVHSRKSMEDVLAMLKEKGMKGVHLHFFEGDVLQAKEAEKLGYMISIPPVESAKRKLVIKEIAIDHIMAESDAPVVGTTPADVERSIAMIASVKGLEFARAAEQLTFNTKKFFGIGTKTGFMRS
jgi:TatD DNase family protein